MQKNRTLIVVKTFYLDCKTLDQRLLVNETKTKRYFVMKTYTMEHLKISIDEKIWATQAHNEKKLNEAFEVCDIVPVNLHF